MLEGAQREFAGLGGAQPLDPGQRFDDGRHDGAPAGDMQFDHVLAGVAARRAKADDQRAVQRLAGERIAQGLQRGDALGRRRARRSTPR